MIELIHAALAIPGIAWVFIAAFVAGIVRGFSGFGTGMIFLPVASQFIAPVWAIMIVMVMDMIGPVPAIPAALRNGHPRDLIRLLVGTVIALPVGLMVLFWVDPAVFRLGVSVVSLVMLAVLVAGLRYHGRLTPPLIYATGGLAGLLGGAVGIPGPPVVLLYMASPHPARVIRANIMAYLFFFDLVMIGGISLAGQLSAQPLVLGLMAALPYLAGNMTGWWIFRPELEKLYRGMAYVIIAGSALSGLKAVILG
ncbi:TSUP family transporter [Aquicoccus sp. G2-2]|uniref:TSUP family transporter n=1 Tax=Aquicoccus sp. G2-2 TaxID=3092120 RepID=UPI002AE03418|nr:TSUP family transporter [Aquicoccus sp. G2-2]MEA1112723.1 TSUP family transporter [Aquicoccus sp. G2-2]